MVGMENFCVLQLTDSSRTDLRFFKFNKRGLK